MVTIIVDPRYDGGPGALRGNRINGTAVIGNVVGGYGGDVYQATNANGTQGQYCYTEMTYKESKQ